MSGDYRSETSLANVLARFGTLYVNSFGIDWHAVLNAIGGSSSIKDENKIVCHKGYLSA